MDEGLIILSRMGLGLGAQAPDTPLLTGFVLNTLFYAALLWLLFLGPFNLRRHLRARRGLCLACGYPVGEAAVCTECEKAVSSRRAAMT